MHSVIHHTFAPQVDGKYIKKTLKLLCMPWAYRKGAEQKRFQSALEHWFDAKCSLFGSGREALLALLQSLPLEKGSEVLIQAYTCVALPNAIHAAGLTPVYVDCDPETLNMDHDDLNKKISPRTGVVICQHTFGIVTDTKKLSTLCKKHGILLIEDCAQVMPDVTGPKSMGKYSDALMLSFGRDKAISGIAGGAAIAANEEVATLIKEWQLQAKRHSLIRANVQLLYPLLYAICKPLYTVGIGKALLVVAKKIGLLVPVITTKEKKGYADTTLHEMPNACCALARMQLKRLHSMNNHRRELTEIYLDASKKHGWNVPSHVDMNLPLQKFPLYVKNPDAIRSTLKKNHIYLDDGWTGAAIAPRSVDGQAAGYKQGLCPNAEKIANSILTLPTHPTMTLEQADILLDELAKLVD